MCLTAALMKRLTSSDLRPMALGEECRFDCIGLSNGKRLKCARVFLTPGVYMGTQWACLEILRLIQATAMRPTWQLPPPKRGQCGILFRVCLRVCCDRRFTHQMHCVLMCYLRRSPVCQAARSLFWRWQSQLALRSRMGAQEKDC